MHCLRYCLQEDKYLLAQLNQNALPRPFIDFSSSSHDVDGSNINGSNKLRQHVWGRFSL